MTGREGHLVELVGPDGRPLGACTVAEAHSEPGRLHRAFSVLLVDPQGRTLLQRRSAEKTRFPLRWANACCGHPAPGESPVTAAGRRLAEEIGLRSVPLTEIGVYAYRAADPASGRVEHEYDHVLLGAVGAAAAFDPDPTEVAELRWIAPDELRRALATDPDSYAPWLGGVLRQLPNGETPR
ncbi:MAG TPA: isopentenyl-diphosphate Delta-isomerase [Micromonosporaceae bacterium]|jgi:isopentenyl-diphosphate delta-isomerase